LKRQWSLLLGLLAIAICVAIWNGWFWREDLLLYDAALPRGPAPKDIVIVAIDDASVREIGRWPWRRATHATLLDRLRAAAVKAVALDLVLTEPDQIAAGDDAILAASMASGPPTVLPLIVDWQHPATGLHEVLPIAPLAAAAAGLAHAHLEIDKDGIARSVFLREGIGTPNRSHLALSLLESVHAPGIQSLPGERGPGEPAPHDVWTRDYHILIPFLGPTGQFRQFSYVDVLRGRIAASELRDKWVLVGATAQGLGDAYPTPRSGEGIAMPGIEITANVLNALQSNHAIHALSRGWSIVVALLPLIGAFIGFLRLSPRSTLPLVAALWVATLVGSLIALRLGFWWWSPATALIALSLAYPLWSWRRLEATQVYLDEELTRLNREPLPLTTIATVPYAKMAVTDGLQARIDRVRDATARLRDLRRLLGETIAALPDAILLVDRDHRIVLANPSAHRLFEVTPGLELEGQAIDALVAPLLAESGSTYQALAATAPASIEIRHPSGRDLMLRAAPFHDDSGVRVGTVIDIVDVSALKSAARERDDTIRFLSHDLRSPSSSLLGLAQLLRDPQRALAPAEAALRIEALAGRTLALADGFIALARAQFIEPNRFDDLDLRDALQDAIDEVWAAAEAKHVKIEVRLTAAIASVRGDRQMLGRALINLLNNAVKYSNVGAAVKVSIQRRGDAWVVDVEDQGPGIAHEQQGLLFQRFRRAVHHGSADPGGVGLGLAFVRLVAQKHGGRVEVRSDAGCGSTFSLCVPAAG